MYMWNASPLENLVGLPERLASIQALFEMADGGTPQRASSPSKMSKQSASPSFMRPTAATATRTLLGSSPAGLRAGSMAASAASMADLAVGSNLNAEARAQALRAVQLRSQLRQQRIKERVEQASTAEASYMNPAEQWESYLARCGKWSPNGRGRKPSPERLRLAHQTATRIFSEAAAEAEKAVVEALGPHEVAAAVAAQAGSGPAELRAPIVDSHGLWVGEKVEAALSGAAGASSTHLWRKKEEQKLEQRRLDFMAKAAERNAAAASGMHPNGADSSLSTVSNPDGVAGLSSQSLYKNQRERSGLLDEHAKRHPTPPGGRLGAEDHLFDTREVPVKGAVGGVAPRRAVAGMTSGEIIEANTSKARGHGAHKDAAALHEGSAGVRSAELAAASTEMRLEAATATNAADRPARAHQPHQRLDCEVKAALVDGHDTAHNVQDSSLNVVSNAPSSKFDGAAGMSSGEVRKVRSDLGQKRHTNPLDEGGNGGGSGRGEEGGAAGGSVTAAAAAPVRPSPVPRLAIAPGTFSMGGSPEKGPLAAEGLSMNGGQQQQEERFAGQKSSLITKPTNAWEARHLWSEQQPNRRPGSPRGGFGQQMSHSAAALQASGAMGMTSSQLAAKSTEIRLETAPASHQPRSGAAAVAAASAAGGNSVEGAGRELFAGAAGLTSGKICEIGPGQVNKFDHHASGSPGRPKPQQVVGRVPGAESGAAGLTSQQVAAKAISEQTAEPKPLSAMAAHAAQRSEFASGGGIQRSSHISPSMYRSGAAGVTSDQKGIEVVKREFMESVARPPAVHTGSAAAERPAAGNTPRARGQASPTLRRSSFGFANSSAGVASAIFGGESAAIVKASSDRLAALGVDFSQGAHGLSSSQVALNRLVSRQAVGAKGGKRSASEPRRRPGEGGEVSDAGSLIYGNKHAQMERNSQAMAGGPRAFAAEAALAHGHKIAGRTSADLAIPREERRVSRMGNIADNLMGCGGLGGFMGGGGGAPEHTGGNAGNAARRHSVGQALVAAQMPFSPARGCSPRAIAPPAALQCNSPARPAAGMRVASPAARFGRENGGSPAAGRPSNQSSTWVTSSSAVGAGWGSGSEVAQAQAQFRFVGSPRAGMRA